MHKHGNVAPCGLSAKGYILKKEMKKFENKQKTY
jgi:hypothetical protein